MNTFAVTELREWLRLSAIGGDSRQTTLQGAAEHDRVVRTPCGPKTECRIADGQRRAAARLHFLELSIREETDPFSVGREEWIAGSFRTRDQRKLEPVQRPQIQLSRVVLDTHVNNSCSVWRNRHMSRRPCSRGGIRGVGRKRDRGTRDRRRSKRSVPHDPPRCETRNQSGPYDCHDERDRHPQRPAVCGGICG